MRVRPVDNRATSNPGQQAREFGLELHHPLLPALLPFDLLSVRLGNPYGTPPTSSPRARFTAKAALVRWRIRCRSYSANPSMNVRMSRSSGESPLKTPSAAWTVAPTVAVTGLVLAVVSLVLGIYNTWQARQRHGWDKADREREEARRRWCEEERRKLTDPSVRAHPVPPNKTDWAQWGEEHGYFRVAPGGIGGTLVLVLAGPKRP